MNHGICRYVRITLIIALVLQSSLAVAARYELTRNSIQDPKVLDAADISLYQVKLGDPEAKAVELLIEEKIAGIRAEQEGTFILLWDKSKPTGAMAGVRIVDGKVDLIFMNDRFSHKVRGIFRTVLTAKTAKEIRDLLGNEDFQNETLMGAKLLYEEKGFLVNFLDSSVNVEFCLGCSDLYSTF
ncbi:MAG: hypothetical protein MRJ96_06215 [Nitrospirales bacterium]|nr:hypothetical protein [Nitrospira sp.]MDR4501030.1 hypothetical protein [Nitrospirales bacterium]